MVADIAQWLRGLGLEQYEPAFRDNDVDGDTLVRLTADDLRELGVASIGHRRRLLDAIAALAFGTPSSAPDTAAPADPSAPPAPASDRTAVEGERRQLTVMFCDLVGSTALAVRSDPEDLREIIGAYHRCVADTASRFAGFVAKYMGDGVLIYFGYPQAHEDDAERAVRAGLAIIEAVAALNLPQPLAVRLGIASGLVVVGDLIGEGEAQERTVVGETPNLAARLQAAAAANRLVIADATRRQLGGLFDVEDLGPQALPGFNEAQRAWQVIRESGVVSRFEALRSGATPLVGRDEEIDLLRRRWLQAKAGEGRVVLLSGEPGIGKSRLAAALSEIIGAQAHTRLRYFCSPHHQDSALYPFIVQLERAGRFDRNDTPEERLKKLETLLAAGLGDRDDLTLVAELLSLPNAAAALNLSAQRKREKLFEALLGQLAAITRGTPVLFVIEDTHWIDPTSRELLDLTIDRVRRLPVLLVITFRPEFQPPWSGQPHVTSVALNRLAEGDGTALVRNLVGNAALAADIITEIVERTDGVPLFVEELTKAVLESADTENRVAAVLATSPAATLAIPATLQASLIARLDRLGTAAKEVAQVGAVLGREFSYELIERVAARPELDPALGQLSDAGLLFCRGVAPHATYLFKHALVQDAAYGTLLRARRQELHARVAAVLENEFADRVERQPELLAHHLTGAAKSERAVAQWLKAGQYAGARLAHREAIRHFDRGISLLTSMPDGSARDGLETELQLGRGLSLLTTEGFISEGAAQAYERARALSERSGDQRCLFIAIYGQWQGTGGGAGNPSVGRGLSQKLLELTSTGSDRGLRLQAHHSAWTTCLFAGEPVAGAEHCEAGRELYDPELHQSHRLNFGGHDPAVCARYIGSQLDWLLGYPDRAIASANEAVALAEQLSHPFTLLLALTFRCLLHLERGAADRALHEIDRMERLAAEQRFGFLHSQNVLRATALVLQNALADAISMLREALDTPLGLTGSRPHGLAALAKALALQGDQEAAMGLIKDALQMMDATGHRQFEPEFHRIRGLALVGQNRVIQAQHAFEDAILHAQIRQMKSYELRAAISLARLWGEQGRRGEAHELLAPVYGSFSEGFDTADLREAKGLLDDLS